MSPGVEIKEWGTVGDRKVYLYTFTNKNGMKVSLSNIGAAIQSVFVKDKKGVFANVVLGHDSLEAYRQAPFYMGTIVGRYANCSKSGKVETDEKARQLTLNDNGLHYHSGKTGLNKKIWLSVPFQKTEGNGVVFSLFSHDGEEGFPGNLQVRVKYTLTDDNRLLVDFWAETDQSTLINLTQHVYINLGGEKSSSILGHQLMVNASKYLPVNDRVVPTGQLADVAGTPFDFRLAKPIGRDINHNDEQLNWGAGYNHAWVLKSQRCPELIIAAKASEGKSGRVLTVYTTEPAVHIYTGSFSDGSGTEAAGYQSKAGFCLGTQNYPDAADHAHFPDSIVAKGEFFECKTIFEFGLAS